MGAVCSSRKQTNQQAKAIPPSGYLQPPVQEVQVNNVFVPQSVEPQQQEAPNQQNNLDNQQQDKQQNQDNQQNQDSKLIDISEEEPDQIPIAYLQITQNRQALDTKAEMKLNLSPPTHVQSGQINQSIGQTNHSIFRTSKHNCQICNQHILDQIIMTPCMHEFHQICLKQFLTKQIQDKKLLLQCVCNQKLQLALLDQTTVTDLSDLKQLFLSYQCKSLVQQFQSSGMKIGIQVVVAIDGLILQYSKL